jgi:hypothetical protein
MMEKLVEWMVLAGEPEVLEENLPRRHKSHLPDPGANPGRRGGKPRLPASAMARPVYQNKEQLYLCSGHK